MREARAVSRIRSGMCRRSRSGAMQEQTTHPRFADMSSGKMDLKAFAHQLLAHEASVDDSAGETECTAFRICGKLRRPLGELLGLGGYCSLLSRAVVLANLEVSWLRALCVNTDGTLGGLDKLQSQLKSPEAAAAEVVLVSQLLGLLVTFIGSALTLRLLHGIWPTLEDLQFDDEIKL
jgi:hypothetical protein